MQNIGLNNTSLKQQNRGLILKLIATGECTSRIELSKKTGLSKMAASNIIGVFIEGEVIEEKETQQVKGKGRNPIGLHVSPKAPKMLGVYLFREECSVVLCDLQLNVLNKTRFPVTEENHGRLFYLLCRSIDEVLQYAEKERIYGIGIGSLGPVDICKGMILNPPNFYGITNMKIVSALKEKYEMPVYFDSQYNCAALAEKYYGNGRNVDDFIFVGIANGIGSGIISNGEITHTRSGFTSELGHISIDWKGERCICGNRGCLESYTGSTVIRKKLMEVTGEKLDFRQFCDKAEKESDEKSDAVFHDMTEKLACGLTTAVNLYNPQKIIIGHEGFWIPDKYIKSLEQQINDNKLSGEYQYVEVEKSFFGSDTHIRGCACSLLMQIFNGTLF